MNTYQEHNHDVEFIFNYLGRRELLALGHESGVIMEKEDWRLQILEWWPPMEDWIKTCVDRHVRYVREGCI